MSFPKLSTGRVDKQVTSILTAYTNNDFIADKVLPVLPVAEESGLIPQLLNSHLRIYNNKRSLYDESAHRMGFEYDNTDRYAIDYFDTEVYMPDRLQKQIQAPFNVRRDAGITAMQSLMLERENALATLCSSTAIITNNTTLTGADQYTNPSSTPVEDVELARTTIYNATGREANAMIIGRKVFNALKIHPAFASNIRGANERLSGTALLDMIADYFEIPRGNIFIGKSIKITSNEGQTETKSVVWGNDIVVFYRPDAPSIFAPSFGYSFTLTGENLRASTRRHFNDTGDIEKVEWAYTDHVLDVNCAYLIKSAVA